MGSWNNGKKYKWMNLIAVAEILVVSLYLMMPFVPGAVPFSDDFSGSSSTTPRSSRSAPCCC